VGANESPVATLKYIDVDEIRVDALRVLILDDDPEVGRMLARVLKLNACAVELVETSADARARLVTWNFDVILADHNLGIEGTSESLLEYVRSVHPAIRRVLITGSGSTVRARALGAGLVHATVAKPLPPSEELLDALGVRR
jgi:CheY-like chemotaxis protein